jgi:hypothetical protein
MRFHFLVAACLFASTSAFAADTGAQQGPQNPAIKSPSTNASNAPVTGANSFTLGEARSHIAARGYSHIRHLSKDSNGVWRGTAMKDGQSLQVSLDYQGNVTN